MIDLTTLRNGRTSFEQRAWSDSHRLLTAADRDGALEPEDLERVATAAYLLGRDDESEAFFPRMAGVINGCPVLEGGRVLEVERHLVHLIYTRLRLD